MMHHVRSMCLLRKKEQRILISSWTGTRVLYPHDDLCSTWVLICGPLKFPDS